MDLIYVKPSPSKFMMAICTHSLTNRLLRLRRSIGPLIFIATASRFTHLLVTILSDGSYFEDSIEKARSMIHGHIWTSTETKEQETSSSLSVVASGRTATASSREPITARFFSSPTKPRYIPKVWVLATLPVIL